MNFFLFYQKKRINVSSFFFLGHSSGLLGADGKKRWDVFSAHRGQRRQAVWASGRRAAGGVWGHSAAFDTAPSFAYNANCSILTISRAI